MIRPAEIQDMPTGQTNPVLRFVRKLAAAERTSRLSDRELLQCFLVQGDEGAFAALVRRHGPMVLSLCRRVLHSEHDAEDAFQATFLILSRKAASLRPEQSLGGWLHAVTSRIAHKALVAAARRRDHERAAFDKQVADPLSEITLREAHEILHRELARLPDKFRLPLVLCYLEGLTRDEAARQLRWSASTLKSRLEQARDRLRSRLASRGLLFSGALLASLFSEQTTLAAVPTVLANSTIKAATLFAAGPAAAAGVVSAKVVALTEGGLRTMFLTKVAKIAAAAVLVLGIVGAGALVRTRPGLAEQPMAPKQEGLPMPRVLDTGGSVTSITWSADGKMLATVSVTYDVKDNDGKKLFVDNSTVKLWDVLKGELKRSLGEVKETRIRCSAFSLDGKSLALSMQKPLEVEGHEIQLLDAEKGEMKRKLDCGTLTVVALSPDGKTLAFGGRGGAVNAPPFTSEVKLFDVEKGEVRKEIKRPLDFKEDGHLEEGGATCLLFSPDSTTMAAGDMDHQVRLWDARTGELKHTLEGHSEFIIAVAFSLDGKTLASVSGDNTVMLWDVQTSKRKHTLTLHKGQPSSVAFSPDGKILATGGGITENEKVTGGEAILWDAQTGELKQRLPHVLPVSAVAFSPDGKILATGTVGLKDDKAVGELKLWQLDKLAPAKK
jgi:RNA polymerase sigma factor (sigma-70 family)